MKILFVAAEGAPFAKTGGLGDVIGALPKSLVKNGHEVAVILPYYDVVSAKFGDQVEDLGFFYTNVGWRRQYVGIKKIVRDGVTFFFIDNEQYFNRGTVYGEWEVLKWASAKSIKLKTLASSIQMLVGGVNMSASRKSFAMV